MNPFIVYTTGEFIHRNHLFVKFILYVFQIKENDDLIQTHIF